MLKVNEEAREQHERLTAFDNYLRLVRKYAPAMTSVKSIPNDELLRALDWILVREKDKQKASEATLARRRKAILKRIETQVERPDAIDTPAWLFAKACGLVGIEKTLSEALRTLCTDQRA